MRRSAATAIALLLAAGTAQARDWAAEARRTAIGFLPTVAQSVPAAAVFHTSYCVVVEAVIANHRGRELTPWAMLECIPAVGSGLARLYRQRLPRICSQGPDAFPYHHSRQSFYIIDRTRESHSHEAYRVLCGRWWRGHAARQDDDDL